MVKYPRLKRGIHHQFTRYKCSLRWGRIISSYWIRFLMTSRIMNWIMNFNFGEHGKCSGESTRLPPMWPGFKSRRRSHMWVEFVVGSLPCSKRFFSGYSSFPLSSKTNISKFQLDQESVNEETLSGCATSNSLFILFYLFCRSKRKRVGGVDTLQNLHNSSFPVIQRPVR